MAWNDDDSAVKWDKNSFYVKELRRWDAPKREGGMNRNGFEEFPKMVYRTQPHPISGRHEVAVSGDIVSLDKTTTLLDAQAFNASCQAIVNNADEQDRYIREGWRTSQAEALQFHEDEVKRLAIAAAEKNHDDRNMSEAAKAEAAKFEASTPSHVAEIPEQRKGRKPMSEEAKAKMRATLALARAARGKKNESPAV